MDQAEISEELTLIEASKSDEEGTHATFRLLLILGAMLLMLLPFVTTTNEFLTRVVETLGLNVILTDWIVPTEARMISVLLSFFGIPSQVSATTVYIDKGGFFLPVYISWNCVGWQSFILFAVTLATGLQGPFTRASKLGTIVVGLLGTFLVNLLRITSVVMVAYFVGQMPALIYHDYGGTVIVLVWLFGYWWFSHGWLLETLEELPETDEPQSLLRGIYRKRERRKPILRRLIWWKE